MNGYEQLANAIALQTVKDYRLARKKRESAKQAALVKFFRSKWFSVLSDLDGKRLLQDLRKQMGLEG